MQQARDLPTMADYSPSLLRTLLTFAETGSVSEAAEVLRRTQPVISRRLQVFQLRSGNMQPLLEKHGRLRLTARGQAVLPVIRSLLAKYDELEAHLKGKQTALEVARVTLGNFAAQLYLPSVLAEVQKQSAWRLQARLARGKDRILGLVEGRCDLAVVTHDPLEIKGLAGGMPSLVIESLAKHTVVVVAHPKTTAGCELRALPSERAIPLERLVRWPLIGLDEQSGLRRKLQQHLRGRGKLRYTLEGQPGGWAIAKEYARHQLGAALLPQPLLTPQDREDFVVRRLSSSFVIEDLLIVREEKWTLAQAEAIDFFQQAGRVLSQENRRLPRGE